MIQDGLPKFENPPVAETILSVQFAPIAGWHIPHFGNFWNEIRDDYPKFEVKTPIDYPIENFNAPQPSMSSIEIIDNPQARIWFIDKNYQNLVQVQHDRFIYNWRKKDSQAYPQYQENIRPTFDHLWTKFRTYIEGLSAKPQILQYEVSYINHIEQGQGWESANDLPKIFKIFSTPDQEFLPEYEDLNFNLRYRMPNTSGRLYVTSQRVIRNSDSKEVIQLVLAAKLRPEVGDPDICLKHLDKCREWVVKGFKDITTPRMHSIWRIK